MYIIPSPEILFHGCKLVDKVNHHPTHSFLPLSINTYTVCPYTAYIQTNHSIKRYTYIHARHNHLTRTSTTKVYYFIFKIHLTASGSHVIVYLQSTGD